ncbi:MAG: class I SAM-dependent methyltransferase [Promethearchaeota archaeon]
MSKDEFSYNFIANDYDLKRKKPWKDFAFFISYLQHKNYNFFGYICDLGCANGRNLEIFNRFSEKLIGIDNSIKLLEIAKKRFTNLDSSFKNLPQLILGDIRFIPIRPNAVHNFFSVATIHHIKSKSDRKDIIAQIHNILKLNGYCCITLWRKFQKRYRNYFMLDWLKRIFNSKYKREQKEKGLIHFGDKLVSWTISTNNKAYHRFYHFFSKREAMKLLEVFKIKEFKKEGGPNRKDNFFILTQKVNL